MTEICSPDELVEAFKGAGEPTRLRILNLLREGDLTVSDLTRVLEQSQPRVSRHLRLLMEAGLIERFPEGSWVFYRKSQSHLAKMVAPLLEQVDPINSEFERDFILLADIKAERAESAARYFAQNAENWKEIRARHISEEAVEKTLLKIVGTQKFGSLLDIGTGTGRMLQLFSSLYQQGTGIDLSLEMLALARANLANSDTGHAQVRFGNILNLETGRSKFDFAILHQVLHYLDDPFLAVQEASNTLRPSGRLLIVDFAPHCLDFLREDHAHLRLGLETSSVKKWIEDAGLVLLNECHLGTNEAKKQSQERLTVSIWLAKDQRVILA